MSCINEVISVRYSNPSNVSIKSAMDALPNFVQDTFLAY